MDVMEGEGSAEPPSLSSAALSEVVLDAALERYRILKAHLEDGATLAQVARANNISSRTAKRWLHAYRREGLSGLARKQRADLNTHRFPNQLTELIEGLALRRPAPTIASVHRQSITAAEAHGWPRPSYTTVRNMVRQIDPALRTLAHKGAKAYANTFDLVHRRTASHPNAIWQADHTLLDIIVFDHRNRPARPWLTAIMDDHSRAIAGYALNLGAPSSLQTALALRQAVWRKTEPDWHVCGTPAAFYTDHGSDFTSRHLEQVALDLKMRLVFSTPGVPRGRGKIERFFETVNQLLLCEVPGYAPAGTAKPKPAITLSDLDERIRRFIVHDYNQRLHSEIRQAPQRRWEAHAFIPRLPDSLEALDLLLLTVSKSRKVHPDGIHFEGMRYLDLTLAAYVGETVSIRYDPRDLAEIRVFHHGALLCRAVCAELAGETLSLKDVIRARNQRRRSLAADLKQRGRAVEAYLPSVPATAEPPPAMPSEPPVVAGPALKRYANE